MVMKYTVAWRFLFGEVDLGFFYFLVVLCRYADWHLNVKNVYLILGLPEALTPLSANENPGAEDASPRG